MKSIIQARGRQIQPDLAATHARVRVNAAAGRIAANRNLGLSTRIDLA
jgi:hypothetical protein